MSGDLRCDFCCKSQREVAVLVAGVSSFICDECAGLLPQLIAETRTARSEASPNTLTIETEKSGAQG